MLPVLGVGASLFSLENISSDRKLCSQSTGGRGGWRVEGGGTSFWSGFLSVKCRGSGELLMSADHVRHAIKKKERHFLLL